MKKKMRDGISLLLVLMLCVGMLPGVCLTAAAYTTSATEIDSWTGLQTAFTAGGTYKLAKDIYATAGDTALVVGADSGATVNVTLNLNGHVIDRGLANKDAVASGNVITVKKTGNLTVTDTDETGNDSSNSHTPPITYTDPTKKTSDAGYTVNVTGGVITGGNNTRSGGGIVVDCGTLTLNGGTICNNHSGDDGGGIFVDYEGAAIGSVTIGSGATIAGNVAAGDGGGVEVNYGCTLTLNGGTICCNQTGNSGDGGGVDSGSHCVFEMKKGTISGNKAHRGGGLYNNQGTFKMSGGAISENIADQGGGIFQYGATYENLGVIGATSVVNGNARIEGNVAAYFGGGVHLWSTDSFTLSGGARISGNKVTITERDPRPYGTYGGGGVFVDASDFTMGGSSVIEGNCAPYGGGVFVDGTSGGATFYMLNGTISGNKALDAGGGVFVSSTGDNEGHSPADASYFYMSGGVIGGENNGNEAYGDDLLPTTTCGGGVYLGINSYFRINSLPADYAPPTGLTAGGNPIINYNRSDFGGGVYASNGTMEFAVAGNVKISDNQAGTWTGTKKEYTGRGLLGTHNDNVYLTSYHNAHDTLVLTKITVKGPLNTATKIGVTSEMAPMEDTPVVFTYGFSAYHTGADCVAKKYFTSDSYLYIVDNYTVEGDTIEAALKLNPNPNPPSPPPSGPSETTYPVTIVDSTGGKVTSDKARAAAGATVTLTVTPEKDYALDTLTVTNKTSGAKVETKADGGKYTFTMPASEAVVTSSFKTTKPAGGDGDDDCPRDQTCPMYPYTDLDRYAWYHDGVHYCIGRGFMIGYGDDTFLPSRFITRAELVQVFFNVEKQPAANADLSGFKDLDPTAWYIPAFRWAVENNIIEGYGDGSMRPNEPITREQIAAVYMRYSAWKGFNTSEGENTNILSFPDVKDVSEWAIPYVQWAVGAGLMVGRDENGVAYLTPLAGTMRSEAATLQMRFCEKHGI